MTITAQHAPNHLVCPFISDDVGDESLFPQMTGRSSSVAFKESYWKCMAVLFASFRRYDRGARCTIVTNSDPWTYCDGSILRMIEALSVDIAIVQPRRRSGVKSRKFGNVLYMIDALHAMERLSLADHYMCLDPDCIFVENPDVIWRETQKRSLLYYDVGSGPHAEIADLNLTWLRDFALRNGWAVPSALAHAGGEFLAVARPELARLLETIDRIQEADAAGRLTMEEHVLSLALAMRDPASTPGNAHVRRIWTGPRRRDARPKDLDLQLWHLPREKQFGFSDLYGELSETVAVETWIGFDAETYRNHVAERMGVPTWSSRKWLTESPRLVSKVVGRLVASRGP